MEAAERIKQKARELGFELAGIAPAGPTMDSLFYQRWLEDGWHGEMSYLEGRRGDIRSDVRSLMPSARSVICVGMVYNTPEPYSTQAGAAESGWISRYAWGKDYHSLMKRRLRRLADWIRETHGPETRCKVCVDTSPVLERSYARAAGLGWIGKNCCLIDERIGSWFFLGEILTSLELVPDGEVPDRCGTCRRCIDACPTDALVQVEEPGGPSHALDSRLCIAYWTIELKGSIPTEHREDVGQHVFGCDICQDVCPWNTPRRAAVTQEAAFQPRNARPELAEAAALTADQFKERYDNTPLERGGHAAFLRNVAIAMGNSGEPSLRIPLERMAASKNPVVREHAIWALERLGAGAEPPGSDGG